MAEQKADPRAVRKPDMDKRWTSEVEERVLDIVGRTGSPKMAAQQLGIGVSTIHDHRRRDPEFGAKYAAAMDTAFHQVLSKAFERSLDDEGPSDRLIEVLLKFRWPERLNGFLAMAADGGSAASAPVGLDPRVIARMEPQDRALLVDLLGRYLEKAGDVALEGGDGPLLQIN